MYISHFDLISLQQYKDSSGSPKNCFGEGKKNTLQNANKQHIISHLYPRLKSKRQY